MLYYRADVCQQSVYGGNNMPRRFCESFVHMWRLSSAIYRQTLWNRSV